MRMDEDRLKVLMAASLDGDGAAHAALLRALTPSLRAFYRGKMGTDDMVEDLVQETLIAVHFRRASYDRQRPLSAWLFSIARYKMIDHLRRTRGSRGALDVDDLAEVLGDGGFGATVDAAIDVERMLATLPPKQAAALRGVRLEGRSVAETASAIGISESDVKVSAHRGLKALAARFGRRQG